MNCAYSMYNCAVLCGLSYGCRMVRIRNTELGIADEMKKKKIKRKKETNGKDFET